MAREPELVHQTAVFALVRAFLVYASSSSTGGGLEPVDSMAACTAASPPGLARSAPGPYRCRG